MDALVQSEVRMGGFGLIHPASLFDPIRQIERKLWSEGRKLEFSESTRNSDVVINPPLNAAGLLTPNLLLHWR